MNKRSESLDILRAAAILLVLGNHLDSYPATCFFLHCITEAWHRIGWAGVDLFFVLSGFLISGLLFKEYKRFGRISFKRFFIRRGFKIYPAFYFFVFFILLCSVAAKKAINLKEYIPYLFYIQDYVQPHALWSVLKHTWSLAVEEQFYILLPLMLIFLYRKPQPHERPFRYIPLIFIFIGLMCLVLRIFTVISKPYRPLTHFFPIHLRMDALFFGVVISYFYHWHPLQFNIIARRFKYLFLISAVILCLPELLYKESDRLILTIGLTWTYLASGFVLIAFIEHRVKANIVTKLFSAIGRYSYSIYLWHWPIVRTVIPLFKRSLGDHWFLYAAIYVIGSIAVGIGLSKGIEMPMLKLRDRLYPSRSNLPVGQGILPDAPSSDDKKNMI